MACNLSQMKTLFLAACHEVFLTTSDRVLNDFRLSGGFQCEAESWPARMHPDGLKDFQRHTVCSIEC